MLFFRKKCKPCADKGIVALKRSEIKEYLALLKTPWRIVKGQKIVQEFDFDNYTEALDFVNQLSPIIEVAEHYPDIYVSQNKVRLELWTLPLEGVTEDDFILATAIEEIL